MLLNGIADAVAALQQNVVPPCLAWESIVLLLKAGQTIIFGEEERSSWKVLMAAGTIAVPRTLGRRLLLRSVHPWTDT